MSTKLIGYGPSILKGSVIAEGSKNSSLGILASTLLVKGTCHIERVPQLVDTSVMLQLLAQQGIGIHRDGDKVSIVVDELNSSTFDFKLVSSLRASIMLLGPLVAIKGYAEIALPGGCVIGARPIDEHLQGLRKLGAQIHLKDGNIIATCDGRLQGADIAMQAVSVTGTKNLMMAACVAKGITKINNCACEPEIEDLANFLNKCGAKISGAGTNLITIEGVAELGGCNHRVCADSIEAGTLLIAGAMSRGIVRVQDIDSAHLSPLIQLLKDAGCDVVSDGYSITVDAQNKQLKAIDIATAPWPGFATDLQAQMMAFNCVADGTGIITETVFENRFGHVPELQRLGAKLKILKNSVTSEGVKSLYGAPVTATDLRASASLVLASLVAKGQTVIEDVYHLDRGYSQLEKKLAQLGAKIDRV